MLPDLTRQNTLFAAVLLVGAANGLLRRAIQHVNDEGFINSASQGFGSSFIIWLAIFFGISTLLRHAGKAATSKDFVIALLLLCALCIPVATISWISMGLAAFAFIYLSKATGATRAGLAILAFVAMRGPIADTLLRLFAQPLLGLDAVLVSGLLNLVFGWGQAEGNFVIARDGHALLVLVECASYANLSIALLGWYSLSRQTSYTLRRKHYWTGFTVACLTVLLNEVRMMLMALSPEAHHYWHEGDGLLWFEGALLVAIFLPTWLSIRNDAEEPDPDRDSADLHNA